MTGYIDRIVDAEIAAGLNSSGALVIHGARAVGKTESARRVAASELRLDASDARAVLAREQPASALDGPTPRLLDEWQLVPELWNAVRHEVDDRRRVAQFILSGSATPDDDATRHSGAGRFRQLTMRTLALTETGESSGAVSLGALLAGDTIPNAESPSDFETVVTRIVTGGWPGWHDSSETDALARGSSYAADIAQHDFPQVAGTRRDPRRFMAYMRAIAGLSAQPAGYTTITRRMQEESSLSASLGTVPILHDLAERMFLVEDQPAWAPRLRSRSALLQMPKRHLADPSLAAALLGAGTKRLLLEPETLGFLFESQVVHDLRVYAQALGARGVFHYRDSKGRDEIDIVIEDDDGSWVAIEVKLGIKAVDSAASNLLRVTSKIARQPAAVVIVVPSGVAHRRIDGVFVVPLTTLGV
ncbi:ATP-binding protein [Paramicrobacterium chengjingii]|uniref:ATP-binding protein n=1 Tax=Paramicrobacterium chengjingii TaxID=2769067 RepID=A0ABX6YJL3_9MICO|nr:DUF4143 domain-containing protein [Microbacterium chengjingii]QPZ38596.1 ATP-binding protein [Microbacterium chengjingii]